LSAYLIGFLVISYFRWARKASDIGGDNMWTLFNSKVTVRVSIEDKEGREDPGYTS
jgi:hypothetical protein